MTQKYMAQLFYLGTCYCGWQAQKQIKGQKKSLQKVLEKTLKKITQEKIKVVASGRTDAGVHACGQVVHFELEKNHYDINKLKHSLNALLPNDMKVLDLKKISTNFHTQKDAIKKQYSYYIQQGPSPLPLLQPYTHYMWQKLNIKKMQTAMKYLIGKRDFKPFQASGAKQGSTVREIIEAEVKISPVFFPNEISKDFFLIQIRIVGSGFLKQMVRGIVGTLIQVGTEKRNPEVFQEILSTKKRALLGPTALAKGLWLEKVWY
ncbi:MAG: tRNA pseudouridine(38-40) synthase TruA [Deltaproteobacteria bacterium]|nr:tRNA pseudouridine(38-40) synthase TruA [Deltaproteobacteria bacterium]